MITLPSTSALPAAFTGAKGDWYANGTYGDGRADKTFDFLKTRVFEEPAPLVLYVHGGGFVAGDKDMMQEGQEAPDVIKLVNLGFSVLSINYPLIQTGDTVGVIKCLNAIEEALQDIRANAATLNIIPDKVGYRGKSAGAAAGMYLAGRPNPPNAIAVNRPMPLNFLDYHSYFTTIDLQWMLDRDPQRVYEFYGMPYGGAGTEDVNDFNNPDVVAYAQSVDTVNNMEANSGIREFWFYNAGGLAEPTDYGELVHHPNFTQAFHDKVSTIGWRSNYYTTTPDKSLAQFFKNALYPVAENKPMCSTSSHYFNPDINTIYDPWIGHTDSVRLLSMAWNLPKVDGVIQKVPEVVIDNHIAFANQFGMNIHYMVYPYTTNIGPIQDELDYIDWLINVKNAPITRFEVGYEFYLQKFKTGDTSNHKVMEQINMEDPNNDYTDMLDNWMPALYAQWPNMEYVVVGCHEMGGLGASAYRQLWNQKVNAWVTANMATYPHLAISYHLYAGNTSGAPDPTEEDIIAPGDVDYSFIDNVPEGVRLLATETNYYALDDSPAELALAREFWQGQYDNLRVRDTAGIFTIWKSALLELYNETGIQPLGTEYKSWLDESVPPLVETATETSWKTYQLVNNTKIKLRLKTPV